MIIDYSELYRALTSTPLEAWLEVLPGQLADRFDEQQNGNLPRWRTVIEQLPAIAPSSVDFNNATVRIGHADDCDDEPRQQLEALLHQLHPWRKGPFELFGIHIDTEWRSDLKWNRLKDQISPLQGKVVLDVGCGSGYHLWRMLGAGASRVIGIDPSLLFTLQFYSLHHFAGHTPAHLLPVTLEQLPDDLQGFDTVFSMGVLYHRRSPIDHLLKLGSTLRPGGELVLETLVIEGGSNEVLVPGERYAKMRNVWFIPSPQQLVTWLSRCGYRDIRIVDVTRTTTEEQRATEWMRFESLADFLDPENPALTIEGYPAPTRAIVVATK
jgi:tRNA (mo5U34)-methyltransferase